MPQNFFITGMPKAGKTTLLIKLIEELEESGLKVGGFITPGESHSGTRTAFHIIDVETGKEGMLASLKGDGPKVSKYHVNLKSFESIAIPAMKKCNEYDVFIIDEIGRMELKSKKFDQMIDYVLDSHTPLVVSVHRDYVPKYKALGEVFTVTSTNHERIHLRLLKKATGIKKKPKKKPAPKKKAVKKVKAKKPAKKKPKKKVAKKPKAKKKAVKKKPAKKKVAKKPIKKKPKEKPAKKETPKEKPRRKEAVHEEAKKKAIEGLQEKGGEEGEGFMDKVKDLLGF